MSDGVNNIGNAHLGQPETFFDEGSAATQFLNNIYGVNAVAGIHDQFQVQLESNFGKASRSIFNVPGMPMAAIITYPALLWQPALLFNQQFQN